MRGGITIRVSDLHVFILLPYVQNTRRILLVVTVPGGKDTSGQWGNIYNVTGNGAVSNGMGKFENGKIYNFLFVHRIK